MQVHALRCASANVEMQFCPAGILRMEAGQASIVITGPKGNEFTINFIRDYITRRATKSMLPGKPIPGWFFYADESYEVPIAAIDGWSVSCR